MFSFLMEKLTMKFTTSGTLAVYALLCLGFAGRAQAQGTWVLGNVVISNLNQPSGSSVIASGPKGTVTTYLDGRGSVTASATFTAPVTWSAGAPPVTAPIYSLNIPCSGSGGATTSGNASSGVTADNPAYRMGSSNGGSGSYSFSYTPPNAYTSHSASTYSFSAQAQIMSIYGANAEATATVQLTQ